MADIPDTPRNRGDHDAPHMSEVTPAEDARTVMINRISWGGVLAGAVLALVTQVILNMLGIGIGAATLDPGAGGNPDVQAFSIGAGIWFAVAGIIAAFAGGFAAGRLAGKPKESTAGWHGLTAWAVSTLVILYMLTTTIGGLVGGTFGMLGNVVGAVGSTAQTAAEVSAQPGGAPDPFAAIQQTLQGGGAAESAVAAVRSAVTGNTEQAQEEAAQALSETQGIPIEEARTQVAQYQQQYNEALQQAQQTATGVADTVASATTTGALLGAVSLMLGALAAWFGGRMGAVDPTMTMPLGRRLAARTPVGETTTTTVRTDGEGTVVHRDRHGNITEQRPH